MQDADKRNRGNTSSEYQWLSRDDDVTRSRRREVWVALRGRTVPNNTPLLR
jgi:hypothetical protein